ncbi:MAG: hypothetical protein H7Y38_16550 [Armatimonadetes bacterium]|nr:hypothetical protein [Armatimonadota bacterium]
MSVNSLVANDSQEAEVEQLLRDMYALNERMEGDRAETERLKAETKRLRAEFLRMSEENRAVLARLKVAW